MRISDCRDRHVKVPRQKKTRQGIKFKTVALLKSKKSRPPPTVVVFDERRSKKTDKKKVSQILILLVYIYTGCIKSVTPNLFHHVIYQVKLSYY